MKIKDKDLQVLIIEVNNMKGMFTKIIRELDERWERAKKITNSDERHKEYHDIFDRQNKVTDLMRETIKAMREV